MLALGRRIDPARAIIYALALGLHLWVFLALPPLVFNDSAWYLAATPILDGPHDICAVQPGGVDLLEPPGYPLFLEVIGRLCRGACWPLGIAGIQHLLSLLTLYYLDRMATAMAGRRLALVGMVLYTLYAPAYYYAQAIMTETVTTFAVMAGVYYLWSAGDTSGYRRTVVSAIVLGAGVWTRTTLVFCVPVGLLYVLDRRGGGRRIALWSAVVIVFIGLTPFLNWSLRGEFAFSSGLGRHLYHMAFQTPSPKASPPLALANGPATRKFRSLLAQAPAGYDLPGPWWDVFYALRHILDAKEADRLLGQVALEAARNSPRRLLKLLALRYVAIIRGWSNHWLKVRYTPEKWIGSASLPGELCARQKVISMMKLKDWYRRRQIPATFELWLTLSGRERGGPWVLVFFAALLGWWHAGSEWRVAGLVPVCLIAASVTEHTTARFIEPAIPMLVLGLLALMMWCGKSPPPEQPADTSTERSGNAGE